MRNLMKMSSSINLTTKLTARLIFLAQHNKSYKVNNNNNNTSKRRWLSRTLSYVSLQGPSMDRCQQYSFLLYGSFHVQDQNQ